MRFPNRQLVINKDSIAYSLLPDHPTIKSQEACILFFEEEQSLIY
jgi:hypothetical protein